MKILIIQEAGRHKENYEFRESLCFKRAFEKIGVESVVWGLNYPNFNRTFDDISKDCDIVLLIENYTTNWIPNLSNFKGLKLFWSIDSHCVPSVHTKTCDVNKIDIVLNAIESHSKFFKNQKCYYLPNAYPNELIYPKDDIQKTVNIGFCGNYVNRANWINTIPGLKKDIFVIGDSMVNAINSFKIHFNRNMADDINYRTFETLGCRTLLLTNDTENLSSLFEIGKHLVTYISKEDLLQKVSYYLNNNKEREEIANSGYDHVKNNHTYTHRAERIVEIIKENLTP